MTKKFASHADVEEKKVSFDKLSDHAYAYTAEGDPNTGIVVGDDAVMVIDTQATPVMAQDVIRRIREVTDKPIRYVVLSHYHAVRVLGAQRRTRPSTIIASRDTYELIVERGEQDMKSEIERFPRLFRAVEIGAGPHVADDRVREAADAVARQAAGRDHAARARPHQGRHGRLAAAGEDPVLGRPRRVRRDAVHRRRLSRPTGRRRSTPSRRSRPRSSCRAAARRCMTPERGARAGSTARAHSSRRCSSGEAGRARGQGPAHRLSRDLRRAEAEVRALGDLRSLPAVRRVARLRRGDAVSAIRASGPRERDKEMWEALEG